MQNHFEFCTQKFEFGTLKYSAQIPPDKEPEEKGPALKL